MEAISECFALAVRESSHLLNGEIDTTRQFKAEICGEPHEFVQAKGAICLAGRNLWDDFLYGLGEFDPNRSEPNYEFSDEERIQYAPKWPEVATDVLGALGRAVELFDFLEVPQDDLYRSSVQSKFRMLEDTLRMH